SCYAAKRPASALRSQRRRNYGRGAGIFKDGAQPEKARGAGGEREKVGEKAPTGATGRRLIGSGSAREMDYALGLAWVRPSAEKTYEAPMSWSILIVDDSSLIRSQLRAALEAKGVRVVEAENGSEGLWRARENIVDLVIADIHMPV